MYQEFLENGTTKETSRVANIERTKEASGFRFVESVPSVATSDSEQCALEARASSVPDRHKKTKC